MGEGRSHRGLAGRGGGPPERGSLSLAPCRGPAGERREDLYLLAEAGVAGTTALLRSGSWAVDLPAEAPQREEGPKANPQGSETAALDMHPPAWVLTWPGPGRRGPLAVSPELLTTSEYADRGIESSRSPPPFPVYLPLPPAHQSWNPFLLQCSRFLELGAQEKSQEYPPAPRAARKKILEITYLVLHGFGVNYHP